MDINALQRIFMWCTIINGAWFFFAAMICVFAGNWVYRMQSKWFSRLPGCLQRSNLLVLRVVQDYFHCIQCRSLRCPADRGMKWSI